MKHEHQLHSVAMLTGAQAGTVGGTAYNARLWIEQSAIVWGPEAVQSRQKHGEPRGEDLILIDKLALGARHGPSANSPRVERGVSQQQYCVPAILHAISHCAVLRRILSFQSAV